MNISNTLLGIFNLKDYFLQVINIFSLTSLYYKSLTPSNLKIQYY